MAIDTLSDPRPNDTEAAGRKIAIELLREGRAYQDVHDYDSGACIEARYRKRGQPQDNFVAKFLALVDGKPLAAAGLASVLSDLISEGCGADLVVYERADRQIIRRERRSSP